MAPGDVHGVDAPAFRRATVIASHAPAEPRLCLNRWDLHNGRDEAFRVAAPSLTPRNWAATIIADRAIIASQHEGPAGCKNILKRVSTVSAEFQYAAVEAQVWISIGGFELEIVPKCQPCRQPFEETELERVKSFVAYHRRIINGGGIRKCVGWRHGYSRVRGHP